MSITLKYPLRTAGMQHPAGTVVRQATLDEVKSIWPGMKPSATSQYCGIWLPGLTCPTLVHKTQLRVKP